MQPDTRCSDCTTNTPLLSRSIRLGSRDPEIQTGVSGLSNFRLQYDGYKTKYSQTPLPNSESQRQQSRTIRIEILCQNNSRKMIR
jgi:hypothetical protein